MIKLHPQLGAFTDRQRKNFFEKFTLHFKQLGKPEEGDWLHSHKEKPQGFPDYKSFNKLSSPRNIIYLQPFGEFDSKFLKKLQIFCQSFYLTAKVAIADTINFKDIQDKVRFRKNTYGKQYLAQDINVYLKSIVPKDAYCVMGITLQDIYPGQNWNFVYGWATYTARVGIFSFIRWDDQAFEDKKTQVSWDKILYPSMRTMVHQIGHMFGVTHCVFYRCIMCGFNNIEQNYRNPMEFCPICYRKIVSNIGFNQKARYASLIKLMGQFGFKQDQAFFKQLQKDCFSNKPQKPTSTRSKTVNPTRK